MAGYPAYFGDGGRQPIWILDYGAHVDLSSGTDSVSAVQSGSWTVGISGTVPVSGTFWQATQPISGTVTANQGGSWTVTADIGTTNGIALDSSLQSILTDLNEFTFSSTRLLVDGSGVTQPISGSVSVSNFPATQPISGTVTANQGGAPWADNITEIGGAAISLGQKTMSASLPVVIASDQTSVPVSVNPMGSQTYSGTITALNGTVSTAAPLSAGSILVTLTGTWVATLSIQILAADGATWLSAYDQSGSSGTFTVSTGIAANGSYKLLVSAPFTQIRVISTAFTSGTVNVGIVAAAPVVVTQSVQLNSANLNAQVVGTQANGAAVTENPVLVSGINPAGNVATINTDPAGNVITTHVDGYKSTYTAAIASLAVHAAATDFFTITGSATKTIRVMRIEFSASQTTSSFETYLLMKRSTANSGGTSTSITAVPHDSNNAAGSATVLAYTVNPTSLGTAVGTMQSRQILVGDGVAKDGSSSISTDQGIVLFEATTPSQAIVLRGTSQVLALNFNGGTATGNSHSVWVTWTEE